LVNKSKRTKWWEWRTGNAQQVVGYGALIRIGSRLVVVFMAWGLVLIFGFVALYLARLSPAEREKSGWTYICIILATGLPIAVGVISGESISKMSIHYNPEMPIL
jgi:glycerol uptake facilitator-like aquaporin